MLDKRRIFMDWIKKHVDTVAVLGGVLAAVLWMNGQFNEVKKELAIIKTVLIIKGIMPESLCSNTEVQK